MLVTPDLLGLALAEYLDGERSPAHLRRAADGRLSPYDIAAMFCPPESFSTLDAALLGRARGDVLDLGAGAGRAALALQGRTSVGLVTAADSSRGACACMTRRGVAHVTCESWQSAAATELWNGCFTTVTCLGAGVGMAETPAGLVCLLAALGVWLKPGGIALLTAVAAPEPRTSRLRLEYRQQVGPWFAWLSIGPADLGRLAAAAGFRQTGRVLDGLGGEYGLVLERAGEDSPCTLS